jgi:transcriptional regulator with XRE-family HTH domain
MPSCPRNIIGPQLRRLRYERGLSQPDFAAACQRVGWDISRDIVARIEGQSRWVADFELVVIARVLKLTPLELLEGTWRAAMTAARMGKLASGE